MKLVYLASASKGNRYSLWMVAKAIESLGCCVYAPLLGFIGQETPLIRKRMMKNCLEVIKFCDVFAFLWEGVETKGAWKELEVAEASGMPRVILNPNKMSIDSPRFVMVDVETTRAGLKEWLNGL